MDKVFAFWEGEMPPYLKLCMKTWNFPYILLTYENVNDYTNIPLNIMNRFTMPQVGDIVRAHVLRDNGGYWLDVDTIVLGDLPTVPILGKPEKRENSVAYLHAAKPNEPMYVAWTEHQVARYNHKHAKKYWDLMGNSFTDQYLKEHPEIEIGDIRNCWVEDYIIATNEPRWNKYKKFYFETSYCLESINKTPMIMLHNSWVPTWYKKLSEKEVLEYDCTLSNFIRGALK